MTAVFVDTAFYVAFTNPRDGWHNAARSFALGYGGTMVTTEFVLVLQQRLYTVQPRTQDLGFRILV